MAKAGSRKSLINTRIIIINPDRTTQSGSRWSRDNGQGNKICCNLSDTKLCNENVGVVKEVSNAVRFGSENIFRNNSF